ncbi:MAG: hypothetical protein QF464_05300, partial [Myxococcota bacterium]|nr:hypothetical protein [Myxococcota bacterium]
PECCSDQWGWDIQCAGLAESMCNATCESQALGCCEAHGELGCDEPETKDCVCEADPDCCEIAWDDLCVEEASACGACAPSGPCCEAHGGLGCNDPAIEACVCDDPEWSYCCWFSWDADCAEVAKSDACGGCDDPGAENGCCEPAADGSPGCAEAGVAACVCEIADYCCTETWDSLCAGIAVEACDASCGAANSCGDGICEAPLGKAHSVNVGANGFSPTTIEIDTGDSVTWINGDTNPHTATSSSGPVMFNIPLLAGQQGAVVFTIPGVYEYYDIYAQGSTGTISVVTPPGAESCETCPQDCGACPGQGGGDCCTPTDEPGCIIPEIKDCVCGSGEEEAEYCCEVEWDSYCVDLVTIFGCANCNVP